MKPALLMLLALATPVLAPHPAGAQTRTETLARGRAVAEAWCANCHVVAPGQRSGGDAAPSFANIASRANPDEAALRNWLAQRHKDRMPNYDLSRDEVDGVVAYILSLKR